MTKPNEKPTDFQQALAESFKNLDDRLNELEDRADQALIDLHDDLGRVGGDLNERLNVLEDESDFDEALAAVIGKINHRLSFLEERVFDFPMEEATTPAPTMLTNDLMQQQIDMIAKQSTKFDEPMFFETPAPKEPRFWSMSDTKMNYDLEPFPSSAIHPEQRLIEPRSAGIASLLNDPMTTVATKDLRAMMDENAALTDRIQRAVRLLRTYVEPDQLCLSIDHARIAFDVLTEEPGKATK